jgi:hypothetical protein
VEADVGEVRRLAMDVVVDRLLAVHAGHLVRHDAQRLLRAIFAPADMELPRSVVTGAWGAVDAVEMG